MQRGKGSDQALAQVKAAGCSEGEITEIVANVAVNIFTNYFHHVARTGVDLARVTVALAQALAQAV